MSKVLLAAGLLLVGGASGVAIGAQHGPAAHPAPHQICGAMDDTNGADAAAQHHSAILAAKLDLNSDQRAAVDQVIAEAGVAMTKYHEQVMGVLTPEQRARLTELHEGSGGLHAWFRKLHGAR